jgi:hypothetical protein
VAKTAFARVFGSFVGSMLLLSCTGLCAEVFPTVEGENLLGRKVVLPEAVQGHPAVLVIGFTHASQAQTRTWSERLAPEFETWSIALLEDAPRLVRGMAVAGIKSSVAQNQRDHFLILVHHEKELKASAGFETPNDAYVVLTDQQGAIRWRFHGSFNESALAELKTQVAALKTEQAK